MKKGLNIVQLIGNVGADPEVRFTPSGVPVCNISIAVNSSWKDSEGNVKEHVEWVYVVLWRKLAEIVGEWVKKGSPIYIQGRMQTTKYEHDGTTKYKTEVVADNIILLPNGNNGNGGAHADDQAGEPDQQQSAAPSEAKKAFAAKVQAGAEDDLPF